MEGSVEEAEDRRRKRLERFNAENLGLVMEECRCSHVYNHVSFLIGFIGL